MTARITSAALAASLLLLSASPSRAAATHAEISNRVETHIKRGAPTPDDLSDIQAYVAKNPEDMHGRFLLAVLLASGGYQQLAEDQFDEIYKRDQNYFIEQFHQLLKEQCYETARWIGFYAGKKYPRDSAVLYMQGRLALVNSEWSLARRFLTEAIDAKPVWPQTYLAMAQLSFSRNRRNEAVEFANKALEVEPSDDRAKAIKVAALAEMSGHPERYLADLEKYAPRNWTNDSLAASLAQAYMTTKQYDKAVEPALFALKYGSGTRLKTAEAVLHECMYKVSSGKMLQQLDLLSPLNSRDFLSTVVRMRFAKLLSQLGAHKDATRILLKALQQSAYFAPALNFRLGQEMQSQHRDEDALYFFKTAYELRRGDLDYQRAYERAKARVGNNQNDLARRLKRVFNPRAKS